VREHGDLQQDEDLKNRPKKDDFSKPPKTPQAPKAPEAPKAMAEKPTRAE
jgi:hypothetical protein